MIFRAVGSTYKSPGLEPPRNNAFTSACALLFFAREARRMCNQHLFRLMI